MIQTTAEAFSSTAALRFGWRTALENLKILLPVSAVGALLALLQGGGGVFALAEVHS